MFTFIGVVTHFLSGGHLVPRIIKRPRKHLEVAPWSAAKVEYREGRLSPDMLASVWRKLAP